MRSNNIVNGYRATIIRICIVFNILFLSVTFQKNPLKGLRILRKIQKKRGSIQGLPKIRKFIKVDNRYFFSENIPGWPSAAFNGFFKAEIVRSIALVKKKPLSTIIFAITTRCRLGCNHCYEWNNLSHTDRLTAENLIEIASKIKDYKVNHIQLSGGEPMERFDDLIELIKFSKPETDIWLLTSGYGMTLERAITLKKAGLSGADISLDHWDEDEHNKSRNSAKSYYWVKEAVNNCNRAGIVTTLSLCAFRSFVTKDNLLKYCELSREWGVGFIRILEPRLAGRYKGQDIELSKEQINLLEEFFQSTNISDRFEEYPIVTYPGYHQRRLGCFGAGNRYLYIDSLGDIHACPFCQRTAGNAISDNLEDAVDLLTTFGCQEFKLDTTN